MTAVSYYGYYKQFLCETVTMAVLITGVTRVIPQDVGVPTYRNIDKQELKSMRLFLFPVFPMLLPCHKSCSFRTHPHRPQTDSKALVLYSQELWAHSCCLSPYSLPRSFPPLFFDTSLEFSCPLKTTSNSHLRKEAKVRG